MNLAKLGIKGRRNNAAVAAKGPDDRCPLHRCREKLRSEVNAIGAVVWVCDPCERNGKGLCRDCPAKLQDHRKDGRRGMRPMFCRTCRLKRQAIRRRVDYETRPEHYRKIKNRSSRRPKVRARQLAYVKDWKKRQPKQPSDELTRKCVRLKARSYRKRRRLNALKAGRVKRITPRDFRLIVEAA